MRKSPGLVGFPRWSFSRRGVDSVMVDGLELLLAGVRTDITASWEGWSQQVWAFLKEPKYNTKYNLEYMYIYIHLIAK